MTFDFQKMFLTGQFPKTTPLETKPTQLGNVSAIQSMFFGKEPIQTDFPRIKSAMQPSPYEDFQTVPEYTPQEMWKSISTLPANTIKDALTFIPNLLKLVTSPKVLWSRVLDPDYYSRLQEIGGEDVDIFEWGQNFLHSLPQAGKNLFTRMLFPSFRRTFETAWSATFGITGKIPDPISLIVEAWDNKNEMETLGYAKWFDKTYEETMAKGGAGGFWRTFKRYTDHPLYSIFEDISNVSMIVGTVAKAIELPLKLSGTLKAGGASGMMPLEYIDDMGRVVQKGYGFVDDIGKLPMEYMDDMSKLVARPAKGIVSYPYKLDAFRKTMLAMPKETSKAVWKKLSSEPAIDMLLAKVNFGEKAIALKGMFFKGIKEEKRLAQNIRFLTKGMRKSGKQISESEIKVASAFAQVDFDLSALTKFTETYPNRAIGIYKTMIKYINKNIAKKADKITVPEFRAFLTNQSDDVMRFMGEVKSLDIFSKERYVNAIANYSDDAIGKVRDKLNDANIDNALIGKEKFLLEGELATREIDKLFKKIAGVSNKTTDFKSVIRDTAKKYGYERGIAPPTPHPKGYLFLDDTEKAIYLNTQKAWNNTWSQLPDDLKVYGGIPIDRMTERLRFDFPELQISKVSDITKYFKKIEKGIVEADKQSSALYFELGRRAVEEKFAQVKIPLARVEKYGMERLRQLYDDVLSPISTHWNKVDKQKWNVLAAKRLGIPINKLKKGSGYRLFIKEIYGDIPSTFYQAEGMMLKEFNYDLIRKLSNIKIKQFAEGFADDLVFREAELITGIPQNMLKSFGFKPAYVPHRSSKMMQQHRWSWTPRLQEPAYSFLHKRGDKAYEIGRTPDAIVQSLQEKTWYDLDRTFQGSIEKQFGKQLISKAEQKLTLAGMKLKEFPTKFKGVIQKVEDIPEGFVKASWNKSVVIPTAINDSLGWLTAKNQPKWLGTLFDLTNVPRRLWMKSVLGVPRLAVNNTMGNAVLYALSGGSVKNLFKAMRIYYDYRKKAVAMGDGSMANTMSLLYDVYGKDLMSGFTEDIRRASGLVDDTGMLTSLLGKLDETHPNIVKLGKNANKIFKWGENVALDKLFNKTMDLSGASEGVFRIAAALDQIPAGMVNLAGLWKISPTYYDDLVTHIDKFLFNYWKLTPVESVVFRRIIPFYAWNKNIARLAVTLPFESPLRFHIIRYLGATMEDAYWSSIAEEKGWDLTGEEAQNLIPKYMRERIKLPKGLVSFAKKLGFTDTDSDLWISVRGFNPFADIPTEIADLTSRIDPMIATGIEYLTGTSLWKQRPYFLPFEETKFGIEEERPSYLQIYATKFPQYQLVRNLIKGASTDIHGNVYVDKYGRPLYKKNRWAELLKMTGVNLSQMELDRIWSDEMERQSKARATMKKWEKKQDLYKKKYGFTASIKTRIQNLVKGSSIDTADMGIEDIQKLFLYGDEGRK